MMDECSSININVNSNNNNLHKEDKSMFKITISNIVNNLK